MRAVSWRLAAGVRGGWALWPERGQVFPSCGRFGALLSRPACCGLSAVSFRENHLGKGMTQGRVEELLWRKLFSDPTQWWDNRRSKQTPRHPDFRHKKSEAALWLNNHYKPAWVETQLSVLDAQLDAGIWTHPSYVSISAVRRSVAHQSDLEVETCRRLCKDGPINEAVRALNVLVKQGCHVSNNLYYCVLKRCIASKDLVVGKRIHALSVENGFEGNAFLATHLITLYASHGRLKEAMLVFSKVSKPDGYMWDSIIRAYARYGDPTQTLVLYRQMCKSTVKPGNRIFVAVLKACANARDLAVGKDVHAHIHASAVKPDIFVQTCLVAMYAKCGSLKDARKVFDQLAQKDVVTWTAMLSGYAQQGMGHEALSLYRVMQEEGITAADSITFACLLQACASVGAAALQQGQQLLAHMDEQGLEGDVVVGNSLVNMYVKCGSLVDARKVFDRLSRRDVVTWTAMISGYAQQGMGEEALGLYSNMQQEGITPPNSVTFVCLLQACACVGVGALHQGRQLHAQIKEQGLQNAVIVGNSLINMYAKCGSLEDARKLFDTLTHKDVVTWNAMIAGYAQEEMGQESLSLYSSMQQEGITPPDSFTFACLLQACASVATLPVGKQLHAQIQERGLQADVVVGPSLVHMYAKCGSLEDAQQIFDSLPDRDNMAWGALIAGYAQQGDSGTVFDLVDRMRQDGIQPDGMTLLSVLTVCSHVGLVDKGRLYFEAFDTAYSISPTIEHYTCMVDLLGRAGHLHEALHIVKTMPYQPHGGLWLTLLGACRKWSDVEVGRQAFEFAVRLDEKEAASYVLMSNIYAGAEMWEEAKEVQARRVKCRAWKQPGQSWWTDMDGVMHRFVAGDRKS